MHLINIVLRQNQQVTDRKMKRLVMGQLFQHSKLANRQNVSRVLFAPKR